MLNAFDGLLAEISVLSEVFCPPCYGWLEWRVHRWKTAIWLRDSFRYREGLLALWPATCEELIQFVDEGWRIVPQIFERFPIWTGCLTITHRLFDKILSWISEERTGGTMYLAFFLQSFVSALVDYCGIPCWRNSSCVLALGDISPTDMDLLVALELSDFIALKWKCRSLLMI